MYDHCANVKSLAVVPRALLAGILSDVLSPRPPAPGKAAPEPAEHKEEASAIEPEKPAGNS
jgi:hypothetical protein